MLMSYLVGEGEPTETVWSTKKKIKVILGEGSYGNSVWFGLNRESLEAWDNLKVIGTVQISYKGLN